MKVGIIIWTLDFIHKYDMSIVYLCLGTSFLFLSFEHIKHKGDWVLLKKLDFKSRTMIMDLISFIVSVFLIKFNIL